MDKLKFWARHVLIDLRSTSVAKDTITLNDLIDPYGFAPPLKKASCVISAPTAMLSLYQKPKSNRRPPLPSHWQLLQSTRKYKKNEQNHSICYVSCSINKALWITSYQLTARSYIGWFMRLKEEPLCCYVRNLLRILKAWNEVLISTFFKCNTVSSQMVKRKWRTVLNLRIYTNEKKRLKKDPVRRKELKRLNVWIRTNKYILRRSFKLSRERNSVTELCLKISCKLC